MFEIDPRARRTMSLRCVLLSGCAMLVIAGESAVAQQAAEPAAEAQELPPLEVTTQTKKKAAKKKSSQAAQAASSDVQPAFDQVSSGGEGAQGDTGPGLNLDAPATTGSRLGLSPLETPASVEIITGETIRERGQTSVNQAVIQNATGFTSLAAPGNGGSSLAARGFAGHSSVMQLYDGTRLYVGSGTVTFPFDTWSGERIEVLRGPASVMYGEGAIGGVVNVVPKRPTDYFTYDGEVALGTDGTRRFGVGAGGPINDSVSYRFDLSGLQSDGWLDREGDYESLAFSGALSWKATSDLKFTVSHDHGVQSPLRYFGTPLIDGKLNKATRDKSYNVRDSDVNYVDNFTQFKTEWKPTDWFEVRNVAYRITTNRHWKNVESYRHNAGSGMIDRSDYIEIFHDQEQIGNRFDATVRSNFGGGVKNEFVAGFDVNHIDFRHTNNSPYAGSSSVDPFSPSLGYFLGVSSTTPGFDSEADQYSIFAEDRLTLSKELAIVAGIRVDRPTVKRLDLRNGTSFERDYSDTTWRVGAVYTPVPGLAFYGQYATAVDPVGGLITVSQANSQWDLATGRQVEVGVKQSFWQGRGEWTLAAYDIEKKDILSRDPDDPTVTRQIGQQSSRGIEASLGLQLTDTLRFDGNAAFLRAEYDEFRNAAGVSFAGKRPPNVPEQVLNGWVTWAFLPKWEAYAGVQWVGSMFSNDANTLKRSDYTVVNLGVSYEVDEKSEIAVRAFNVFDEVYALSGNANEWQLAPPRSAEISYRIKY